MEEASSPISSNEFEVNMKELHSQHKFEIKTYQDTLEKHQQTIANLKEQNTKLKNIIDTICEILYREE